jgi:hypothetical protein
MKALSGREFAGLTEPCGWRNRPLKVGLLRHLAKLAEIPDDELE